MRTGFAAALLAGALAISPGLALGEGSDSLEDLVVDMAHSQGQHAALARHFHAKAEEARTEARRHEYMGRNYSAGKLVQKLAMQSHCQKIANEYNAMATEYDAMAKLHEEATAKKTK